MLCHRQGPSCCAECRGNVPWSDQSILALYHWCKKQISVSSLCVCPIIDDKLRDNIVKVYCGTTRLRLVVPQPLWQCYDAISHQWEDRRIKNWRQFVSFGRENDVIQVMAGFISPNHNDTYPRVLKEGVLRQFDGWKNNRKFARK